ncbi:MAG: RsmE family RNA methyltransferase [Thermodesulfobacteriota bacterium]
MDRVIISSLLSLCKEISIKGPPLEAIRFQGVRIGSILTISDSSGKDFRARVVSISEKEASLFIFEAFPSPTESPLEIILLQALPEKERMEWIIQKTTELGVSIILPFKSEKSISLEEREAKQRKAHRWQSIALRAVQQSRRARVPRIEAYRSFDEALAFCSQEGLKIILWEKEGVDLKKVLREARPHRIYAIVGPEGGFMEKEVVLAKEKGFIPIKLGQRILRAETAAITLVSILQYEWGDLCSL